MSLQVPLDKIIPFTNARSNLSQLVDKVAREQFYVISKQNKQKAVLVNLNYFDYLQKQAEKRRLQQLEDVLSKGFIRLVKKRPGRKQLTEEQAYRTLSGKKLTW